MWHSISRRISGRSVVGPAAGIAINLRISRRASSCFFTNFGLMDTFFGLCAHFRTPLGSLDNFGTHFRLTLAVGFRTNSGTLFRILYIFQNRFQII